jgi:predicted patatin/cPLA2 family phospholipase
MDNDNYDSLVLSGGGIKGFSTLGALQYMIDNKFLNMEKITLLSGTSIGGIIAYFLSIGYTPVELIVYLCSNNVMESLKLNNITEIFLMGVYDYSIITEHCKKMTLEKIGYLPTLKDIYEKFGKELIFVTYNLTEKTTVYISYKNFPNLQCLDALRMTSNLPFVFGDCIVENNEYIDGGFVDNFSIKSIPVDRKALGIILEAKHGEVLNKDAIANKTLEKIIKYIDKVYTILMIPVSEREKEKTTLSKNIDTIRIEIKNIKLYRLSLSHSEKLDLFSLGFNIAKQQYQNL